MRRLFGLTLISQHSVKYQEYFLPSLMTYICDKQGEVRQAAAYGIGVMAQFGGDAYAQACAGELIVVEYY